MMFNKYQMLNQSWPSFQARNWNIVLISLFFNEVIQLYMTHKEISQAMYPFCKTNFPLIPEAFTYTIAKLFVIIKHINKLVQINRCN